MQVGWLACHLLLVYGLPQYPLLYMASWAPAGLFFPVDWTSLMMQAIIDRAGGRPFPSNWSNDTGAGVQRPPQHAQIPRTRGSGHSSCHDIPGERLSVANSLELTCRSVSSLALLVCCVWASLTLCSLALCFEVSSLLSGLSVLSAELD